MKPMLALLTTMFLFTATYIAFDNWDLSHAISSNKVHASEHWHGTPYRGERP